MTKLEQLIAELCPDGVEYIKLDEVEMKRGVRVVRSQLNDSGQYPVYQNSMTPLGYYVESNCSAYTTFVISAGAAGEIGFSDVDFWAADDCFYFVHRGDMDNKFLYYALLCQQKLLFSRVRRASVPRLSRAAIKQLSIPKPPPEVQREIVRILDNFTELSAELSAELTLRQKQYEYYRDKLLSFNELDKRGGALMALCEIGTFVRGNGLQKKDFVSNGVGCIHYGQIYTYYGTFADKTKTFVSPELARSLTKVEHGDLVIACTSENMEDVCKTVAWLGKDTIVTGGHASVFKHEQNAKYMAYCFQTSAFFEQKRKYARGAKVIDIKTVDLGKIKIPIPSLDEQERIVAILDKFDVLTADISVGLPAEIALRHKQYEYYRDRLLAFPENRAEG